MTLSRSPFQSIYRMILPVLVMTVFCGIDNAFAQSSGFASEQKNLAGQIVVIPKLIAVIAYVIGTFFAATGLLKLKDWMHEPDKNPINGAVFRMVVASLLIILPHMLVIVNTTFFGENANGSSQEVNISVPVQSLNSFQKAQ